MTFDFWPFFHCEKKGLADGRAGPFHAADTCRFDVFIFFSPPRFFNPPRAVPNLKCANSRTLRAQVGQSDQPFRSKDRLKTHKHGPKKKANLLFFIAFSAFLLFFYGFYGFLLFLPHTKKHFLTFISF